MTRGLLIAACVLTLIALALMVWSLVDPTVWPVMLAMSVAQAFGTVAFGVYGYVVFRDMRRRMITRRASRDLFGIAKELQELDPIERASSRKIEVPAAIAPAAAPPAAAPEDGKAAAPEDGKAAAPEDGKAAAPEDAKVAAEPAADAKPSGDQGAEP